ncbi:MAG: aldo/keto reductase [Aquisalimonadaceae bacterium]
MSTPDNAVPVRRLGRSGLIVSRIVLGSMMFGGRTDETEAARIIADAREQGVNFIDTADVYNKGESERLVGRLIRANRFDWILATKLGNAMGKGPNMRGLSRRWMFEATEQSLKRLGVETIDIQYLHREDLDTPLEETVRAMADLIRDGKVRYFGVSNLRAWRIARLCALCDDFGIDRPVVCQLYYHALNRTAETELLPACEALGLGTVAYSPLARGVLTGKYPPGQAAPEGSRAASGDKRINETEFHPLNLQAAAQLKAHCDAGNMDMAAFAGAWVLANPLLTGLIAGPRTFEQWRAYLATLEVSLGPDDEAAVDAVVRPGTLAIPQYTDPAYPVEGRPLGRH